jgi:undecaprenyl-diphosphatase
LLFRKKSSYWNWIFVWAIIVSYSRVYLGKHYPLDIIAGAICGIVVGFILFKVYEYLVKKFPLSLNHI